MFAWQLNSEWKYDPNLVTELEVRFIPDGENRTRVELEHRDLEKFGERANEVRAALDSIGGWDSTIAAFATETNNDRA